MNTPELNSTNILLGQVIRFHHLRTHMLLRKLRLYPGQPPILFMLWKAEGQSQKDLVKKLNVKPATLTVMLGRMEKAGLLVRKTDPEDLRVSRIYLTDKGREIRQQVEMIFETVEEECFVGFTDEEKILLRRFFIHIRDNLMNACKEEREEIE